MDRRWALVVFALASCDRFLQLTMVPAPTDAPADNADAPPPLTCMRDIASGRDHSCAVGPAGDVYCWGSNTWGETQPGGPDILMTAVQILLPKPAVQIGAGYQLSCARLEDNTVWCWGRSDEGELGGVVSGSGPAQISLGDAALDLQVGSRHACVILAADHSIACWGSNKFGALAMNPLTPSSSTPVLVPGSAGTQQLSVGHRHSCAIDKDGAVECWGPNFDGQIGLPASLTPVFQPHTIASLGVVTSVAASGRTSCAVTSGGAVECWGRGENGELANGAFSSNENPTATSVRGATAVALGLAGGCALHGDNTVSCWGDMDEGDGTIEDTATPALTTIARVTKVSVHYQHSCAIADGKVLCWGDDTLAALGRGTRAISLSPKAVPAFGTPSVLAAEVAGACALLSGEIYCWGANDYGQLGDGTRISQVSPVKVQGVSNMTGLAAYFQHACAWGPNGAVCWGRNFDGELGDGNQVRDSLTPVSFNATAVQQMAMGLEFTCAIVGGGAVQCVGRNSEGELGRGTLSSPLTFPQSAMSLTNVRQIAAGEEFACAIDGNDALFCWGHDADHQLGDGGTTDNGTPTQILTGHAFTDLAAGRYHACALTSTSTIYCWGANGDGQLGQGDQSDHPSPVQVSLPGLPVKLVAGESNTCAIMSTGTVYCWGPSGDGELGNGTANGSPVPIAIAPLANASLLVHSQGGGCAVIGGVLQCWGISKMLGDGDNSRSLPAPAQGLPCQ